MSARSGVAGPTLPMAGIPLQSRLEQQLGRVLGCLLACLLAWVLIVRQTRAAQCTDENAAGGTRVVRVAVGS